MIKLYQFKFSHFCEKARWALDYKGLMFDAENLLPGFHMAITKKIAPESTVPILVDGGNVVQGSGTIITYLDQHRPVPPLTPANPDEAREALEWEEYLGEEIGVTLRLWFYHHLLPDEDRALNFLLDGSPPEQQAAFKRAFNRIRKTMLEYMNINAETAREHLGRLLAAMEKLDETLKRRNYLAGKSFSRADLTACALLERFVLPALPDKELLNAVPAEIAALRDEHKDRPYFQWVQKIYNTHRIQGG